MTKETGDERLAGLLRELEAQNDHERYECMPQNREQQSTMLGLQEAVDRTKRIVELGSHWLSKRDETAEVPLRTMRAG